MILRIYRTWIIHDIFYVSSLEQDTTRKGQVDKNNLTEIDVNDSESGK